MAQIGIGTQQDERPIRFPARTRILEIDGLRGLAILLVLVFHYWPCIARDSSGSWLARVAYLLGICWSGVDLFFVLSGFLIGGILLDQRRSGSYFKTFYVRRACRILPLYTLLILLYAVPMWLRWTHPVAALYEANPLPLWQYALFVQNIGTVAAGAWDSPFVLVTWSLAIEEQFYLLLPLFMYLLPRRFLIVTCTVLMASAPVLRLLLFEVSASPGLASYLLLPCRWDALLLGVVLAKVVRTPDLARWLARHVRILGIVFAILGAAIVGLVALNPSSQTRHMAGPGYTIIAAFYGALLLLVLYSRHKGLRHMARARWLRWLGECSYAIYLLHFPVLVLTHWTAFRSQPTLDGGAAVIATLIALVASLILARISTRTLERYFVRLGHRKPYAPPRQPA